MLKLHEISRAPAEIRLFKAKRLGDGALKHAIRFVASMRRARTSNFSRLCCRKDLDEQAIANVSDNGWSAFADVVTVYACDGDHDSMLEAENLRPQAAHFKTLVSEAIATFLK